jgi:hypothetical protein
MSGYVTGWVLKHSNAVGAARLVLVVIADHASSDGTNSWPSADTIAHEARVSRATVFRALEQLEQAGELRIDHGAGGPATVRADRRPNRYTVLMGAGSKYYTPRADGADSGQADHAQRQSQDETHTAAGSHGATRGVSSEARAGSHGETRTSREPPMNREAKSESVLETPRARDALELYEHAAVDRALSDVTGHHPKTGPELTERRARLEQLEQLGTTASDVRAAAVFMRKADRKRKLTADELLDYIRARTA